MTKDALLIYLPTIRAERDIWDEMYAAGNGIGADDYRDRARTASGHIDLLLLLVDALLDEQAQVMAKRSGGAVPGAGEGG